MPKYERTIELESPPAEVWAALTDGAELREWFGAEVSVEPRVGGRVLLHGHDGERRHGTVEEADAPRSLVFRWWAPGPDLLGSGTRVGFHLAPTNDGGTELTVTEEMLGGQRPRASASVRL